MKNSRLSAKGGADGKPKKLFVKQCLIYSIWFCFISAILLSIASLILFKLADPFKHINITTKIILILSSFTSGYLLAKRLKEKQVPSGFFLGCVIIILLMLASVFTKNPLNNGVIWYLIIPLCTTLGSLLSKSLQNKPKHKKHKR